jgi:two-component system sensor histidine kinase KdpD
MEQVLYNLIYNATQYTPEKSILTIAAHSSEANLVIFIEDDGPGFPEQEIPRVFDKFYRLKNAAAGGTGLGLSIVKGFVEAHKGHIELQNRKEGGARFTIQIPAERLYTSLDDNQ